MQFITEYNNDWQRRFLQITAYLKMFIPDGCAIHHVGSTSVPGMPAKDIIDLDIEYGADSLSKVIENLRRAGYAHEGDLGIPGREAFRPVSDSVAASLPTHHLYACEAGTFELRKHLAFRDYLKANPSRADWLAAQKRLADSSARSREDYIERKSGAYAQITAEAIEWTNATHG